MFEVGNIVWYIGGQSPRVLLLKVVEEITKKTLTGEETSYIFVYNSAEGEKRISMAKLADQGDFYVDENAAKKAMLESASAAIDHMLLVARNNSGHLFKEPQNIATELPQDDLSGTKITLEDGTVATLKGSI